MNIPIPKTTYFLTFFYAGTFVANTTSESVAAINKAEIDWPEGSYCCEFSQRDDLVICDELDGAKDKVFKGETVHVGKRLYHPGSTVTTFEEAKAHPNVTPVLLINMECNGWTHMVWNRYGRWPQPFDPENDEVLPK